MTLEVRTIPHSLESNMDPSTLETKPATQKGARPILEFAEWAGISRTRAFAEVKAGRLKAVKCGRATLVTQEAGEEFLRSLPLRKVS